LPKPVFSFPALAAEVLVSLLAAELSVVGVLPDSGDLLSEDELQEMIKTNVASANNENKNFSFMSMVFS
jgi:hypothetical protein